MKLCNMISHPIRTQSQVKQPIKCNHMTCHQSQRRHIRLFQLGRNHPIKPMQILPLSLPHLPQPLTCRMLKSLNRNKITAQRLSHLKSRPKSHDSMHRLLIRYSLQIFYYRTVVNKVIFDQNAAYTHICVSIGKWENRFTFMWWFSLRNHFCMLDNHTIYLS